MITLVNSPIQAAAHPDIYETALRRQLQVELTRIKDLLDGSLLGDEKTQQIRLWQERFFLSLRLNIDVQAIQDEFIGLLQEILVDPIAQVPLDEEAVLGSDGITYGGMSLTVYIHSVSEELRQRSPLNSQNPATFLSSPHPIVRHMIRWLRDHHALLRSEEMERVYGVLMEQRRVDEAAIRNNTRMNRIRRIRERQEQRELETIQSPLNRELQRTTTELAQTIQEQFIPIHQQMQNSAERHFETLSSLEQRDQQQTERLQVRVEQLHQETSELEQQNQQLHNRVERINKIVERRRRVQNLIQKGTQREHEKSLQTEALVQNLLNNQNENSQEIEERLLPLQVRMQKNQEGILAKLESFQLQDQKQVEIIQKRIQQLKSEVEAIEHENGKLQDLISRVGTSITEAEKEDAQLQIAINETRQAIKNQQSGWAGALLATLGTIGACAFATWAVQGIFLASGSTMQGAIIPLQGGAKFTPIITF